MLWKIVEGSDLCGISRSGVCVDADTDDADADADAVADMDGGYIFKLHLVKHNCDDNDMDLFAVWVHCLRTSMSVHTTVLMPMAGGTTLSEGQSSSDSTRLNSY